MRNILLSLVVICALAAAGIGGTFAGFVDTEVSEGNFYQAGITDLLVDIGDGVWANDPLGATLQYTGGAPEKSVDFWVGLYNWAKGQPGDAYMHIKGVISEEAGTKTHDQIEYVFTNDPDDGGTGGIPVGYREAVSPEPAGAGVWSSEPEKISEVGDGYIAEYYIAADDPNLLGEDYASGIAANLNVHIEVPYKGDGSTKELGNPDTDGDGTISAAERTAWAANNVWQPIAGLNGILEDIECHKEHLGLLGVQEETWIHIDVVLPQIYAEEWYNAEGELWPDDDLTTAAAGVDYDLDGDVDEDDFQKAGWPTNALQGDRAQWDMLFELICDP